MPNNRSVELAKTLRNKKNVCKCENQRTYSNGFNSFRLFPTFNNRFVVERENSRTKLLKKIQDPNYRFDTSRFGCDDSCDSITKQEKLSIKKKPTPYRVPFNHYRKQNTCKTGCIENEKVIKDVVDICECPIKTITTRLISKSGVRITGDKTYKNYLQNNGKLYEQHAQGILYENKLKNSKTEFKIGNIGNMFYNKNSSTKNNTDCMIYGKRPTSLTNITFNLKKIPTATRKYLNPQYSKDGAVSSRSRLHRLKYEAKLSVQISHKRSMDYNNCVNGEICSQYKNPGPNIKNKGYIDIECNKFQKKVNAKEICPDFKEKPKIIIEKPTDDTEFISEFYFRSTFPKSSNLEKLTGDFNILYNKIKSEEKDEGEPEVKINKPFFRMSFLNSTTLEKLKDDYNILKNR